MRHLLVLAALLGCLSTCGCNWGKSPEEVYEARLEGLQAKMRDLNEQMADLHRREMERRRKEAAEQFKKEPPQHSTWWSGPAAEPKGK